MEVQCSYNGNWKIYDFQYLDKPGTSFQSIFNDQFSNCKIIEKLGLENSMKVFPHANDDWIPTLQKKIVCGALYVLVETILK